MKAVPKVNTDGLYIEDEIADDSFNGVVPFYADPQPDGDGNVPEPQLAGYTVGVPVPSGLFRPRFDLAAWGVYQAAHAAAEQAFNDALEDWGGEGDAPVFIPPEQPSDLWSEGMSAEEIAELTKPSEQPSELEQLRSSNEALQAAVAELTMMFAATRGGETS